MARPGAVSRSQRDCDRMGKAGGDGDEWPEACDAKRRGSRRPLGGGRFRGTNSLGRRNGLRRWDGEGGGRRRRQPERLLAKDGHARDGIWQASVRVTRAAKGGRVGAKGRHRRRWEGPGVTRLPPRSARGRRRGGCPPLGVLRTAWREGGEATCADNEATCVRTRRRRDRRSRYWPDGAEWGRRGLGD